MCFPRIKNSCARKCWTNRCLLLIAVTPKQEDLILTGITGDYVEVGTDLELTCTVSRIRPEAAQMYWKIGERIDNGSDIRTEPNDDDGTFSQSKALSYK